jgi:hypothetical protein
VTYKCHFEPLTTNISSINQGGCIDWSDAVSPQHATPMIFFILAPDVNIVDDLSLVLEESKRKGETERQRKHCGPIVSRQILNPAAI